MRSTVGLLMMAMFLFFAVSSCKRVPSDEAAEKKAVQKVVEDFYSMYASKNFAGFSKLLAHDEDLVNFGIKNTEYWRGYEALEKAFTNPVEVLTIPHLGFSNLTIHISRDGSMAYYTLYIDFDITYEGRKLFTNGTRSSGVLEKREGRWLIVHFHHSMPVVE